MYHALSPGKTRIIDGRYYLALRKPPMLVRVQPLDGFSSPALAERFLSGLIRNGAGRRESYAIVEASQIDKEQYELPRQIRAGRAPLPSRADQAA